MDREDVVQDLDGHSDYGNFNPENNNCLVDVLLEQIVVLQMYHNVYKAANMQSKNKQYDQLDRAAEDDPCCLLHAFSIHRVDQHAKQQGLQKGAAHV